MSIEKPSLRDCPDKDFVLKVPHDSLQKRIVTLGRENDLFLMLQIEPGYGERNQETIIRTMAEGLYDDSSLRESLYPEEVESKGDVLPFLKGSSVRARLINEYIQLTIASQLEKEAKKKADYLNGYIAGRLRGNAIHQINALKMAITTNKTALTQKLEKERERLIEKVDFAPTLQAELVAHIKGAPCIPLFKVFLKQKGIAKVDEELEHLIGIAVKHDVVKKEVGDLLARIQKLRKSSKKKIAEPRRETKNLAFKALAPRLEGEKNKIVEEGATKEPDVEEKKKPKSHRKQRQTYQGYLIKTEPPKGEEHDGVPFMEVDELLEEDIEVDVKPIPAVMDAPATKGPDISHFRIPTPPPPIPLGERLQGDKPDLSGPVPASKVFDEIAKREQSGQIDVPDPNPIIGDDVPVLDLDYEPDTVVVDVPTNSGHKDVMPPILGQALTAEDVKAMKSKKLVQDELAPLPAKDEDLSDEEDAVRLLDLGPVVDVLKASTSENSNETNPKHVPHYYKGLYLDPTAAYDPESTDENEVQELTATGKISKWVQRHVVKIAGVVSLAGIGVAGYYIYNRNEENKKDKNKSAIKLAHKTTKDDGRNIVSPPMRRLDEPMQAMKVQKKPMVAPKTSPAPNKRPVVASKPKVSPKHSVAPITKTVNVKGATSQVDKNYVSIDKKTLSDLPEGGYADMFKEKLIDVKDAPHGSITGFMQQQLLDMVKTLPTKKAQKEARRAYYGTLRQLEQGWLIHMNQMQEELHKKSMEGTLTAEEDERLKNFEQYQKNNKKRKWQGKWLYKRYKSLKSKGKESKSLAYYEKIAKMGRDLMEGLEEVNKDRNIVDFNDVKGKRVRFTLDGKVLKTLWVFAEAMKLPMPDKAMGSTGELAPKMRKEMYAHHLEVTDDMIVADSTPPPIPEDAQVHTIDDSDMFDVVPMYGYQDAHMPPPPIPKSEKLHAVTDDMIVDDTPPPIPEDAILHELKESDIQEIPMYGAGPEPELKPILKDLYARRKAPKIPEHVRTHKPLDGQISHNDVYAEFSLERLDGGEYDTYSVSKVEPKSAVSELEIPRGKDSIVPTYKELTIENGPVKETPPPIPAMADVEEPKKKKSLWGRAKSWLKSKVA